MFFDVWGHSITDCLRYLWFLKSEYFNEFKSCPLVYINWRNQDIRKKQKNFCRLLEIVGIDVDRFQLIDSPTQFEKIILLDESYIVMNYTNEYREMMNIVRDFALKNRTPTSNKKIFYFHGLRNPFGEERLAEYFKSKGYDIISPEKLTFDEQLNLLINAEIFASTLGSCAHNSIFLRDGTETIFIPRVVNAIFGYQMAMDEIRSYNANYIDSSLSITATSHVHGPILYIVSKQLKNFFGDKWNGYEEEDFKNFLEYVKYSLNKNLAINGNIYEFYKETLTDFMEQLKQREDLITACNMPPGWETFKSSLQYQTHVSMDGWSTWSKENEISNPLEKNHAIEAIKVSYFGYKVYSSVYYNDKEGWSAEVTFPEMAGTTGKGKPIFGVRIRFDEAGAKKFDILYRVHKFDGEWTAWAKNGEAIYSYGQKLNAIQIKLESKI